ncbi:MAG: hypothetical protein AAFR47_10910 [Pseudomonadota bacterium]
MTAIRGIIAGGVLLALSACGPEGPDTEPPVIQMAEGNSVFFLSSGAARPASCPNGLGGAYTSFRAGDRFVQARSGGSTVRMRVTFSDPSGIKRAYLQIPNGTLRSPNVSQTVQVPTPDGNLSQAFEYNFFGDETSPQATHTVDIDLTHSDSNRVFNVFAIDMNDNRTSTASLLIGEASRICG